MATSDPVGFYPRHYFARSWALLTRDKGWQKPVLLLALGRMVPIFGDLVADGYAQEWARLTAWGINASPKQKNVQVGKCLGAGWRGFVVTLVWSIALFVVSFLLELLVSVTPQTLSGMADGLVTACVMVLSALLEVFIVVATVCAAIYQKISGGLQFRRVFKMADRDFGGLMRCLGIVIVFSLIAGVVFIVALVWVLAAFLPAFTGGLFAVSNPTISEVQQITLLLANSLFTIAPLLVITIYVENMIKTIGTLMTYTAVGLWMRQFDVPCWGDMRSNLPEDTEVQDRR